MPYDWSDLPASPHLAKIAEAALQRTPVVLIGPPGTGRTMVARRIPTILPALTDHARVWLGAEQAALHQSATITEPPFRAPHYTISIHALTGCPERWGLKYDERGLPVKGARDFHPRRAGEYQLARFGVLFLDELTEFSCAALEAIAACDRRLGDTVAKPYLVASAHPCPCGWFGTGVRDCACTRKAIARHYDRLRVASDLLGLTSIEVPYIDRLHVTLRAPVSANLRARHQDGGG